MSSGFLKGKSILRILWFLWHYIKTTCIHLPFAFWCLSSLYCQVELLHSGESRKRKSKIFPLHPFPGDLLDKIHQLRERTYKSLGSCSDEVKWSQLSSWFWSRNHFLLPPKWCARLPPGSSLCQQHRRQLKHARDCLGGDQVPRDILNSGTAFPESWMPIKDLFHLQKLYLNKQDLSKLSSSFFEVLCYSLAVWKRLLRLPWKSNVTKKFKHINNWKFSEILRDAQIKLPQHYSALESSFLSSCSLH